MNTLYNYENFRRTRSNSSEKTPTPLAQTENEPSKIGVKRYGLRLWLQFRAYLVALRSIEGLKMNIIMRLFQYVKIIIISNKTRRWLPVITMFALAWYVWTHDFAYTLNIFGYKMLVGTREGIAQFRQKRQPPLTPLPPLSTSPQKENDDSTPNQANTFINVSMYYEANTAAQSTKEEKCRNYIARFLKVAQMERAKFGIPISIKLAQGLLESDAGDSPLTRATNNHFGIKTLNKNIPHKVFKDDSSSDKFKIYATAWESYRDHSLFLEQPHYKILKSISTKDYESWAKGLQRCGYATDPQYASKLVHIIRRLQLDKFDY